MASIHEMKCMGPNTCETYIQIWIELESTFFILHLTTTYNQALQWMKSIDIEGKGFITEQVPEESPIVVLV